MDEPAAAFHLAYSFAKPRDDEQFGHHVPGERAYVAFSNFFNISAASSPATESHDGTVVHYQK